MKKKNTLVKGMRVGDLFARNKKFALKKERVEGGTIMLVVFIAALNLFRVW